MKKPSNALLGIGLASMVLVMFSVAYANVPLFKRLALGTSFRVQSALPYNITTGRDDNGDTISNDRPAGVTRNAARALINAMTDLRAGIKPADRNIKDPRPK